MLLLLVGITSCNKEEITIEDPEVIIDPPEEIEYPVARGIIKDENGTLANAKIDVYQLGELMGNTFSNFDGEYSTIDIETIQGEDLVIKFSKEDYNSSYRKRSLDILKSNSLDVELVTNDGASGYPQLFPGITEYVSMSGYIKNSDGNSGFAKIKAELTAIYYDDGVVGGQGVYNISYSEITDGNGYYELILPLESSNLRVVILNDEYCTDYLTEQLVGSVHGLAEPMGPFTEDVILPDYTVYNRTSAPLLELAGQVTNCDGSISVWPSVELYLIAEDGFTVVNSLEIGTDGSFFYSDAECMGLPYTIKMVGSDFLENKHSDTLEYLIVDGVYNNSSILLENCNETVSGNSSAVVNVDGVDYNIDQIITRIENGGLVAKIETGSFGEFTIPNIQLGDNNIISDLVLIDWGPPGFTFDAVNEEMTANVISLSPSSAIVEVTGDFNYNLTQGSTIVQGTCTLNLNF